MLHHKSKPEDVIHYISQLEMLLLSVEEKKQISQIMALEYLIKDVGIKGLIAEDLKDETWIKDTQILINTCCKKIEKDLMVQNQILECQNFIVFRFLEEKMMTTDLEIHKQMMGWSFNEVDKHGEKSKWVSQKFMRVFEKSSIDKVLIKFMNEGVLPINLSWLYSNRGEFFSDSIFSDLKKKVSHVVESSLF